MLALRQFVLQLIQ
ncbi:hypothetical protein YPPY58_2781, partial [Yersinia pestis PY-58]